jgi:hypothetical protein
VLISALHLAQIVQPEPVVQLAQQLVLLVQAVLQLPVVPLALLVQAVLQRLVLQLPVVPQVLLVQTALLLLAVPLVLLVLLVLLKNWQIPLAIAVLD